MGSDRKFIKGFVTKKLKIKVFECSILGAQNYSLSKIEFVTKVEISADTISLIVDCRLQLVLQLLIKLIRGCFGVQCSKRVQPCSTRRDRAACFSWAPRPFVNI